ncbi:MAG: S8 family serine peptidase [Oscillospiraceae bacterium]|nr:S8 family serine peptidase [Oscillospiraceae bacterium]
MFGKIRKKILALGLAILLFAPLCSVYGMDSFTNSNNGNENYYQEISQLISSTWDDAFFGVATMSIGSGTMEVDNHTIELDNPAEIVDGELVLPLEALQEIGIQITSDNKGASLKKNHKTIEFTYDNKNMQVNGKWKGMRSAATFRKGKPVVPASVLTEEGLDFELNFDEKVGQIVITNEFQMARVLAKVKPGKALPEDANATKTIVGPDGLYVFQYATEEQAKAACERLSGLPDVLYAEPDVIVTLDADDAKGEPTNYNDSPQHLGWGAVRIGSDIYLEYLEARGKLNTQVIVAVLDTGLDTTHSIFKGRCVNGYNAIDSANTDDIHGHGTHVAGTILDVAITAQNVMIMPVKVLGDNGQGGILGVATGIQWAVENGANVINLSLGEMIIGSQTCSETMDIAIEIATSEKWNSTVIAAAGNKNANAKDFCPAHLESVITVAASNKEDKPVSFSNYGSCVDVAAPGVDIISAVKGGETGRMSGTSMASPHVAGAVALLYCDNPSIEPAAAKAAIRSSVDTISLFNGRYYGSGILNISKAIAVTSYLEVTPAYCELLCNTTQQLGEIELSVMYYDYTNEVPTGVTPQITFTSSDSNVAEVSSDGSVTAKSSGIATITATVDGTTATCTVLVTENNTSFEDALNIIAGISIPVFVTESRQIRYYKFIPEDSGLYVVESGNTVDSTDPFGKLYNANKNLIYQNDDGADNKNFRISCSLTAGKEYYIAASCYGSGIGNYTFSITSPVLPESIKVEPTEAKIRVGETIRISSTILPYNTTENTVKWTSSNISVATVSQSGLVTAIGNGKTEITAKTVNGKESSCLVSVIGNSNIDDSIEIYAGGIVDVTIENAGEFEYYYFTPNVSGFHIIESANPLGSTDPYGYLYDSNQFQIASDDDGTGNRNFRISIYLMAEQKYYIGATCYGAGTGDYKFTITQPESPPTSITVSPTVMIIDLNEARQDITATVLPYNYQRGKEIIWESSNNGVATVDHTLSSLSSVRPISIGTTKITARIDDLEAYCYVTVAEINKTFERAISVTNDVSVPVSVTGARQIRYYKFVPTDSGDYTIESTDPAGNTDPYGYLYFANKALITSDDDGAGNRNFKISYNLLAGQTYYIGAACFGTGTGSYMFSIECTTSPPLPNTWPLVIDAPYGNEDTPKIHIVEVTSAEKITIALTGAKNDIYSISLWKDGAELAKSESSRVISLTYNIAILETGEYEVRVKKESAINGLYSLTVKLE